jgi:hypothetical protein
MATKDLAGFTPASHVLFQELEGEMVLLNLETEHYYGLDDVGTRFWQLLTEHGDMERVLTQMIAEFDVDEATIRADVTRLVSELSTAGLLVSQK